MSRLASMDFYGQSGAKFVQLFNVYKRQVLNESPVESAYTVRGPDTLQHRMRAAPRSGDQWTTVAVAGEERYALDSMALIGTNAFAIFVPMDSKMVKQFAQMRMEVSDALVQMEGFEEFAEAMLAWGENGAMEQIEQQKRKEMNEAHKAATQAAREKSEQAKAIYGEEWGAF
jgi:hypothetical protein